MALRWLYKLGYEYKDVCKDVFMNKHKQLNIIEDSKNFFKKMKELKPYIVEFEKDNIIKPKLYHFNYIVKRDK